MFWLTQRQRYEVSQVHKSTHVVLQERRFCNGWPVDICPIQWRQLALIESAQAQPKIATL